MYHFVGIKGSGMSALAQIMKKLGYEVQGSDVDKHFFTEEGLIECNIDFFTYDKNNIKEGMKIIRGESITDDNPEIIKAKELELSIYSYVEMLGNLTKKFNTICIAGCHGKTTTTSMMSHVLNELRGANYLIGDGTGFAAKDNELFILESCEYRRHFLQYTPYYAVITNIDLDHVDYYKDIDDVIDAYREFANKTKKMVIACGDDPYTHTLEIEPPIFYYGLSDDNDIKAINVTYKEDGTSFEVEVEGNYYGFFDLPIYGKHMLLDALAVIAICYYERMEAREVSKVFKNFKGAKRRFSETIIGNNIIIDDYAHHPNEVEAVINAVRQKYEGYKLIAFFQGHTFSRVKMFYKDFARVLSTCDEVILVPISKAREKEEDYPGVSMSLVKELISNSFHESEYDYNRITSDSKTVVLFMSPSTMKNHIEKVKKVIL